MIPAIVTAVTAAAVTMLAVADTGAAVPPPARPGVPPSVPYVATEVVVRSPDGPRLAGTLTLPTLPPGVKRAPAVVLISGSSAHDRDYTGPRGYRLFWWLADTLSRRGIAVLRLDNRGVGGSTGSHDSATTAQRAGDVRAAVALLRARPDVDPARVGLVGISEGGLIAPMLAADDTTLAGIVLMAAPGENGRAIAAYQYGFRIDRDSAVPPADRLVALGMMIRRVDSLGATRPWAHWVLGYDPLPAARRVRRTPVLLLQGTTDRSVPPEDAERLAAAMRAGGNADVTVRLFPGLDHAFVPDPDGDLANYAALPSMRVPAEVLGAVADWTAARRSWP